MAFEADRRAIDSHQRLLARVKKRVLDFAMAEYDALGTWDDDALDAFVARVLPIVEEGQRQVGELTTQYLRSMADIAGYDPPEIVEPAIWSRKTDPEVAYARPVKAARKTYAKTEDVEAAKQAGANRLMSLIATDLQLAQTNTAVKTMAADPNIGGYRRVLTGAENCALCVLASTQRYRRGNLMPIHHGCDCTVAPIYGPDPGQFINQERYLELQQSIRDQLGAHSYDGIKNGDYRQIMVREHGEIGPTLSWRRHEFTGPSDI